MRSPATATVVASDLDRTLLYSPSALMLPETGPTRQRLVCVEVYRGRPLSFVTERAAEVIAELAAAGVLVPVTTRTVEQYQRILLPGPPAAYALCANGGRLLRDGVEDADFTAATTARLAAAGAPAPELLAELTRVSAPGAGPAFVQTVRDAAGLFCYAVVERGQLPPGWVEHLTGYARERGWTVSVQGRKVYVVPAALSKAVAARRVAELAGARRLLAAGDSLLDAPLLEEADAAVRPAHGELADAGWTRPHVEVTSARGVLAGEEIVVWMRAAPGCYGDETPPARAVGTRLARPGPRALNRSSVVGVSLTKGGNVSLTKQAGAAGLTAVTVGLGWDLRSTTGTDFDLDASALGCKSDGKVLSDQHFVFFSNLVSPEGAIEHTGDNLTGEGEGDDEQIKVNLASVPAEIDKVVFPVSIYDADSRSQSFGQVRNAFIRVVNQANQEELARYDLTEDASTETAMVFGELYRNGADWKFRAVGQGYASGLAGIAKDYGVNV